MGEAKRQQQRQAIVTDIEAAGAILADVKTFCDQCGAEFPLWPPELLNEHLHEMHSAMFWPTMTTEWDVYKSDTDLARRKNYVTAYRVKFLFIVLQNRCDLYEKCVAAGVIVAPAQG